MSLSAIYKGPRLRKPRTIDSYCAITETAQYTFNNSEEKLLDTVYAVTPAEDMNQLQAFEPRFQADFFINGTTSPMAQSLFNRFDEFRIRSVEVKITSQVVNPVNFARSDVWIWWTPNHFNEDEDAKVGDIFTTVTDMEEASHVSKACIMPGKTLRLHCVPQLVVINQIQTPATILDNHGDRPAPWLRSSNTNKTDNAFRMPVIYFRKPFISGLANQPNIFQITLTATIEFRQLDDNN